MTSLVFLGHMSPQTEFLLQLLAIAACVLGLLTIWGSLWLLRRIIQRMAPDVGIRHFGLRLFLIVISILAVVVGYNVAVLQSEKGMPPIYVCETKSATDALRSVQHATVVSIADIKQAPGSCLNHNVFAIPETLSNKEIMEQVETLLMDVRPCPWVRVLRFPASAEGRSVETWINSRKEKMNDIEISSAVWRLVYSQHRRPQEPPHMTLTHGTLAFLPPVAVLLLVISGRVSGRSLATYSVVFSLVALLLPVWNDVWGFAALPACFFMAGTGYEGATAVLGLWANLLFVAAYAAYWQVSERSIARLKFARIASVIALVCGLTALYPLSHLVGQMPIYMGFGVWIAGLLSLAIGSWRTPIARIA